MRIDQRNGGASLSITTSAYSVDRWRVIRAGGGTLATMSAQRVSSNAHPDFTSALLLTFSAGATLAATSQHALLQHIEGVNAARLKWGSADAKSLTVSFRVRASVTGTYPLSVCNSAANRSYVGAYTVNAANTWESKTVTIPGDTSGTWLVDTGKGVTVYFGHGDGSNFNTPAVNTWQAGNYTRDSAHATPATTTGATWQVTGVQAEIGSSATDFDHQPFDELVRHCQRYYFKTFPIDQAPTQGGGGGDYWYFTQSKAGTSTADMWAAMRMPIMMRAAPTVTGYNPVNANAHPRNYSRSSDTSASAMGSGPYEVHVTYTSVSNAAVGDLHFYNISADAELV
jgi:hypothetical protein